MTGRPSGTSSSSPIDAILAQLSGKDRRVLVNSKIRGQTGLNAEQADLPSVHLRWGLQQMKLRGWRADDWGKLFDGQELGDGPICLLESVQAPMDAPSELSMETPEQFYLRSAFVELGWGVPLYLSTWNDEQQTFEQIEALMLKAIELAEADERDGLRPYLNVNEMQLRKRFGITPEVLKEAKERQDAET